MVSFVFACICVTLNGVSREWGQWQYSMWIRNGKCAGTMNTKRVSVMIPNSEANIEFFIEFLRVRSAHWHGLMISNRASICCRMEIKFFFYSSETYQNFATALQRREKKSNWPTRDARHNLIPQFNYLFSLKMSKLSTTWKFVRKREVMSIEIWLKSIVRCDSDKDFFLSF